MGSDDEGDTPGDSEPHDGMVIGVKVLDGEHLFGPGTAATSGPKGVLVNVARGGAQRRVTLHGGAHHDQRFIVQPARVIDVIMIDRRVIRRATTPRLPLAASAISMSGLRDG